MTDLATRLEDLLRPVLRGGLPVRLTLWDGSAAGPADAPRVEVRDPTAVRRLLWYPVELGAAQAYVTGELDIPGDVGDVLDTVRGVLADRGLDGIDLIPLLTALPGLARFAREAGLLGRRPEPPVTQARLRGRLHTKGRDRSAISHHYDLSNEFYELLLDPQLAYSSAWFADGPDMDLESAQAAKLDLVCRKVGLTEGARFLDVGCGWGSLSLYAAEHFGAQVTGVTIAAEQKAFIDKRIRERGLDDRVQILLHDYRDVHPDTHGEFDAAASIEMGEHVGQANYPTYVEVLRRAVVPGAYVLIQQMSRRGRHPGGGPFIESFIAPDMHMRPVGETVELLEAGGLEVRDVHALREHYVWTVDAWLRTFEERQAEIIALVGEEMARVWRLYLIGGRAAFRDGRMGVDQILARKPDGALPRQRSIT